METLPLYQLKKKCRIPKFNQTVLDSNFYELTLCKGGVFISIKAMKIATSAKFFEFGKKIKMAPREK